MAGCISLWFHPGLHSGRSCILVRRGWNSIAMTTRIPHKLTFLDRCNKSQKAKQYSTSTCSLSSSSHSEYLQTISHAPTMHFQPAIPQLPIPSLQDTCQRYLATQRVFLSPREFNKTKVLVEEFVKGEGREFNYELVELNKKNSHTSYITDAWLDAYLTYRASVVLNSNPVIFIADDHRPAYMEQTLRATNIIISLLRFLKTLRADKLVPDAIHKNPSVTDTEEFWRSVGSLSSEEAYRHAVKNSMHPLDMSQFSRIFNANRIPWPVRDELFQDETQRHVLVLCVGHLYVFDVLDKSGSIVPGQDIRANLQYIIDQSISTPSPDHPVGYLTTHDRDTWTHLRQYIVSVCKDNEDNMRLIDSSLFCLCLEGDIDTANSEQYVRTGLYGNAGNRWFDKTFQLITTKDGHLKYNMEHSWGDGITMKRVISKAYQDTIDRPALSPGDTTSNIDSSQAVKKLDFTLDSVICQGIEEAQASHAQITDQLNIQCMEYEKYGYSFLKECRVSPDAVAQLALQIAYHRVTDRVPATYESCSTALYKHGRTETIRSATAETKRCAEAFNRNSGISPEEKRSLVNACSDKHRQLIAEATAGQGWDCHLFALQVLAANSGKPTPNIFQDPAYADINTITLLTSTVGVSAASIGAAFAPESPSGLGIAYTMMENGAKWICTGYPTSPSLLDFGASVQKAYDEIHEVLTKTSK